MQDKSETPSNAAGVAQPTSEAPLAAPTGYAAGPSKWEIWPLLMALGFICMSKNNSMAELYLRALTIVALTYTISHRICKRHSDKLSDPRRP